MLSGRVVELRRLDLGVEPKVCPRHGELCSWLDCGTGSSNVYRFDVTRSIVGLSHTDQLCLFEAVSK